jgi:hypothetical protein
MQSLRPLEVRLRRFTLRARAADDFSVTGKLAERLRFKQYSALPPIMSPNVGLTEWEISALSRGANAYAQTSAEVVQELRLKLSLPRQQTMVAFWPFFQSNACSSAIVIDELNAS